ncbi:MAG: HAD family hydrolase, partial [Oscillospiraceae bacterium]|nr:HAD family hydrolase [Oscillospiraceae bacterium]
MGLKELVYPLDTEYIIAKKRSLKKQLKNTPGLKKLKIALLSGSTIGLFADMLELFLLDRGFEPEFF